MSVIFTRPLLGRVGPFIVALGLALGITTVAQAQFVMMPDSNSANNRLVLFSPVDGSLVNSGLFGLAGGTTVHAMQVGQEIWVSEQLGDRISRWSFTGTPLGAVTGALDNVRGMEFAADTVFLANDGTGNGAPGPSLQRITPAGALVGFFPTTSSPGPFGILDHNGGLLVASDAANNDIHKYKYDGADDGVFHNSASLNFAEQIDHATNGDILAAAFSSNVIARLDPNTGAILQTYPASGARGVYQLGNGNILWSNSAGAHVLDPTTGQSTLVYAGGGRFFDDLVIPEPGTGVLIGLAGSLLALRRARRAD